VWDFVRQQRRRLWLEFLPAYAPDLNPTEYIWGHLKQHEVVNLGPKNLSELSLHAIRALKRMRRRPTLIMAFWQQVELFPLYLYYAMLNRCDADTVLEKDTRSQDRGVHQVDLGWSGLCDEGLVICKDRLCSTRFVLGYFRYPPLS
jgi:hypothetical protein